MGKRLFSTFYDILGAQVTVDLYDSTFSGTATTFTTKHCQITYDSTDNDDLSSPIIGSRAKVGMVVPTDNTTLTTFVEDFSTSEEDRFTIEITKAGVPDVTWRGILVPDFTGEEDTAPSFVFNISAVCGLGLLKKKPYHDGAALYTGIDTFTEHLATSLSKIGHTDWFWGASDVFIRTAVDWWSVSMANGNSDDSMFQGGVDHAAFYNYQNQGNVDKDVLSCYDVLWHILKTFECRIFQIDGAWWIEQIAYRTSASYYTRHYSKTGGYLSFQVNSGVNTVDQTTLGAKIATVNYDFLPALKKATVKYDVKIRRNFLNGFNLSSSGGGSSITFDQDISSNGGDAITRLRGTIYYGILNNTYSGTGETLFAIPNFMVKIGTNYLKRDYTISNFTANLGAPSWTASTGDRVYVPILLGPCPSTGGSMGGSFDFEVLTPTLPSDGDANILTFSFLSISKWTGDGVDPSHFTVNWSVSDLFLEIYDEGTPIISEDQIEYESVNPDNYTQNYETNIRLGTAILANSAGRIMRWNGSVWTIATLWGQGVDTRDDAIGDLLARNLLNARDTVRRRLNGTIYGTVNPKKLLSTSDGKKWMFGNVTWDLGLNSLQGTWFELNYGAAGVNSTPIKIKIIKNGTVFPPTIDPATPSGMSNNSPGFNINQGPTVLAPVAYNALQTAISSGATVSSIPIKTASLGNEFLVGDGVTLVNPYTGQFQTFEISAAPIFGATSLSVTSEVAANAFPEDSYLVVKQNAYAFSLPTASTGDYLYFDGTEWISAPFDEDAQDAIGAALVDTQTVNLTYTDLTPSITADVITQMSITADASGLKLSGDSASPGNSKLYGTDGAGAKGWYSQPTTALMPDGDYGDVTVSGTGTVINIDAGVVGTTELANDAVTFAIIQDISTDKLLGRDTALTGNVEEIGLGASLEFSGTSTIQRAALTGDVTAAANSNATTIAADAVTFAKMQNIGTDKLLGRDTAASGNVEEIALNSTLEFDGALNLRRAALTGDVTATAGSNATTIANDAVTYAKMQNVLANNVILGNDNGVNQNVQELTVADVYTLLGMSGQANRFAVWTGSNTLTHNAAFTYLVDRMTITGTVAGGGAGNALLNINTGALAGTEFLRCSGNISGNLTNTIYNSNNTNAAYHTILQLVSGGSAGGDAIMQFTVSGQMTHAIGIDNSNDDRFKITPNATTPGGNVNMGICVRDNAGIGSVGINNDFPSHPLDGFGIGKMDLWVGSVGNQYTAANVAFDTGAGTGGILGVTTITGSGNCVELSFSTGNGPAANARIFTISYPFVFPAKSIVAGPGASNANAATDITKFYIETNTNTEFTVKANGTLTANTDYILTFNMQGY